MSGFSRVRAIGTVAALLLVACGDDGSATDASGATSGGITGGEVRLEPADGEMPNPFIEENLDLVDDAGSTADQLSKSIEGGLVEVPGEPVSGGLVDVSGQTASGDDPGLYGGTMDEGVCDADQLVAFLTDPGNAEVAQEWAEVQGVEVDEIEEYVGGLTPVRLAADTRVTNHGFEGGEATRFQSILQAGTAVLVDEQGVPRTKCFCGNPLAPPEPVDVTDDDGELVDVDDVVENPEDAWDGFDPQDVMSVEPGRAVDVFELSDFATGARFARPVGTNGAEDEVVEPGPDETGEPGQPGESDDFDSCRAQAEQAGVPIEEACGPGGGDSGSGGSESGGGCQMPDPEHLSGEVAEIQQYADRLVITYGDGRQEVREC